MHSRTNTTYGVVNLFSKITVSRLFWVVSFSILTAIGAQIAFPVKPVPFTLQTMIVLLSGAVLGAKDGAYSQILYLLLGSLGLPVFAHVPDGTFGIARLFGPTGGYLLAFPLAAYITGYIAERSKKHLSIIISMFIAELTIIITGTLYLNFIFIHNIAEAFKVGAAIFSVWMVIKIFAAAGIYFGIIKKSVFTK